MDVKFGASAGHEDYRFKNKNTWLRKMFGLKKDKMAGRLRELRNS
jgi:hypothetical protein